MMIADSHGHIFPPLSEACGFDSVDLHLLYQQWSMHTHGNQPVMRARDSRVVPNDQLWDPEDPSENGRRRSINFRVDGRGRFAWETDGDTHYIQFLDPGMTDMASPAGTVVAQMDYVGIDRMVLQNDHIYGNSAEIFADAMRRFPDRFIGLAQIEEGLAAREDEVARLEYQVAELGMCGLYFTLTGFMRAGWAHDYTHPNYRPLWDTVDRLRLPVFWVFPGETPFGSFEDELRRFKVWLERYPDIHSVIVHGWPTGRWTNDKGIINWPEIVVRIQNEHRVHPEILYPIGIGGRREYPFTDALSQVRQIYDEFGASRLVWGSDMPNVERYCTYRQSYSYLAHRCDYMDETEREALFGGNLMSLFEEFGT